MELKFKDECYAIVGSAFEVYNELGFGFLETVYQEALAKEFSIRKIPFIEQAKLQINYKTHTLNHHYFADFICFADIIIELKAIKAIQDETRAQTINYLKATNLKLAVILNFGNSKKLEYERLVF
jgi:GxxExxY protein